MQAGSAIDFLLQLLLPLKEPVDNVANLEATKLLISSLGPPKEVWADDPRFVHGDNHASMSTTNAPTDRLYSALIA